METAIDWIRRYPDHREGIAGQNLVGTDAGAIVSLEDDAWPVREAIVSMARHLWSAVHVGHPAPIVEDMRRRMDAPRPGDLVVEHSALATIAYSPERDTEERQDSRIKGLGYLITTRIEWFDSAADWAAHASEYPEDATEDNRSTDDAWYVQYGPNPEDVCRWTNCSFVLVPIDSRMFRD